MGRLSSRSSEDDRRESSEKKRGGTTREEYAYSPFGGGPRHCLGMRFTTTELKLAVATICQRVELDTPLAAMPAMNGGMTLSSESPIEIVVRRT